MTNEHHERIQKENDVEELRRLAHVHVSENDLLRQRVQHLVTELAKERGLSEQDLFEQDAASSQKAKGPSNNKYGKGSRRSRRNPRRDNAAPKAKPALGAAPRVEQAVLELDEADQICPDCGGELSHRASLDQHSKLITLEHTMILQIEVTRKGYACCGCDHIENALAHEEQFVAGGFYGLTLIV